MATISIDIDTSRNEIYLAGDIADLKRNRFAWRYIKGYLHPIEEINRVIIPILDEAPEEVLIKVTDMLKKYGFLELQTNTSEQILIDFHEEEHKFVEFSEKALHIRNNECDKSEFAAFSNVIASNIPNRSLYPLQLLSAYHLAFSQNACNFSVPGAGKTSIVYGAYAYLRSLPSHHIKYVNKLLIIGPLSSFGPWEIEFEECFGCKPSVKRLVSGINKNDKRYYLASSHTAELTLISYQSLPTLQEELAFFLRNNKVMVVLDEAHKAKNSSGGIVAQSVLELAKYSKARVVLTGTPAPNGYEDLYNMFKFIWPTKNIVGYQVNQLRDMSTHDADVRVTQLIRNISPYFIRIRKSDLNIPPATVHPAIHVPMKPIQQRIYDYIEKKYIDEMLEEGAVGVKDRFKASLARARMIRLMQAASDPAMLKIPLREFALDDEESRETFKAMDDVEVLKFIMEYEQVEIPAKYEVTKRLVEQIVAQGGK